ncbi:hypothetical protein [Paraburkholderia guartelaensis]|uniref:Uncharacterized protein n=1 Tax=Paraburkholderia guartelaensis TaxID=2546446 RepID=A0ABU9SM13_9BURK
MVVPGMGIARNLDSQLRVMSMMGVMRDAAMHAAQHLGHRRRDHAQQDGKHPEPGTDLLTVAVKHGESTRRKKLAEERLNLRCSSAGASHRAASLQQAAR